MFRKKHQWKIAYRVSVIGYLCVGKGERLAEWLPSAMCGWLLEWLAEELPDQLASWLPYHRFSVSWAKCEWKHLLWVSSQLWTYLKVRLCVFVCVLLTSHYICGRLWLSAHRASAKLEVFFFSISVVWCRKTCCTEQLTVLDIPLPHRLISLTQSHAQLAEYMYMTNSVNRIINRNCYVMISYVCGSGIFSYRNLNMGYDFLLGTHF